MTSTRAETAAMARSLVAALGGRYSTELGIDVDSGDAEVERWFLAATLFGTRISANIAARAFRQLDGAGITRIGRTADRDWGELMQLLDSAGYTRYDFRTATRLQSLAAVIHERYQGSVAEIGRRFTDPSALAVILDQLPGWGPVTIGLFLRELRGVWPGADPPLDARAANAARHLGLVDEGAVDLDHLGRVAASAGVDVRDLEAALVRVALHHRKRRDCPGGRSRIVFERGIE